MLAGAKHVMPQFTTRLLGAPLYLPRLPHRDRDPGHYQPDGPALSDYFRKGAVSPAVL